MRHLISGRFLLLLAVAIASVRASAQNTILGVLEENEGHYFGDPNYRTVRVVFEKKGNEWQAFRSDCDDPACLKAVTSSYPSEVKWTIAFDGKNVGEVVSRTPSDFLWYSDIGQQVITSKNPVPMVGTRSPEFGGFTGATVYRPLVANSKQYFADPDRWKPFALSPALTTLLQQAFRKRFPKLCRTSQTDQSKLEQFPYRNEAVKAVKAYTSGSGSLVARLHLEAVDCQDTEAGFAIDDPWFFVDTKKTVTYLDSGMWLVDAGDYDNDGKSELIFSISRYNEGGYEIWYDNFEKHATFKFNYH
jgi:hypothetical protein